MWQLNSSGVQESKRSPKRGLVITVGAVAGFLVAAGLADTVVATRAEHNLSRTVAEFGNLEVDPAVYMGGTPYIQALFTGEVPMVSVDSRDVDLPEFGLVNARTEAVEVELSPRQVMEGTIVDAPVTLITRRVSFDGVALGAQLGMTDLDIAHPKNISPSGGTASEALLTGTPEGFAEPVSALVTLRLSGSVFRMQPVELFDVPPGLEQAAREAFSWEIDTLKLPLGGRALRVSLQGGSIYFEAQARNVTISTHNLTPVETQRASDYDSSDYGEEKSS